MPIKNSRINPFRFHIHFIEALLDALELEKVSLVGISMGGGISLGFALANPQRVRKLVLVSSYGLGREMFGGKGAYLFPRVPLLYEIVRRSAQRSRRLVRLGMSKLVSGAAALTGEMLEDAWQSLRSSGVHHTWKAFLQSELTFTGYRTHFGAHLQRLSIPTLIVHGDKDRLIPLRLAEQAARQIPGARLHIFKNCGHLPPREKPGEFNEVLGQFLKDPGKVGGGDEAVGSKQ
ncbi:MAG: alpha/beta fold hydrolase [Calditrichaceae bacterium]|nr:alpha/beta fold hydrolase [Calditrichaceae bacterium]